MPVLRYINFTSLKTRKETLIPRVTILGYLMKFTRPPTRNTAIFVLPCKTQTPSGLCFTQNFKNHSNPLRPKTLARRKHLHFPPTMANNLDMSLDDLIKKSNRSSSNGVNRRGRGGNYRGPGPDRRFDDRKPSRMTPYSNPKPMQEKLQPMQLMQTMFLDGGSGAEAGTKLYISNLDYGVSNDDLKLLFSEVGELKRYSIHYDKRGRSKGTAEVVFIRQSDAIAAIKRYNNMRLDGKPLRIELVGVNVVTPIVMPPPANSKLGKPQGDFTSGLGRGRGVGFHHGNWHGQRPTGRRQERAYIENVKPTAKDLDADLESYRLAAMNINKE